MSTKLTRSPRAGYDLVDSQSLSLAKGLGQFKHNLTNWLISNLHKDGFDKLTPGQLSFLGELDCGDNHASELARHLNISRQAVHKIVHELCAAGWLDTVPHPSLRNQKIIQFTIEGERMMAVTRQLFAELDARLVKKDGAKNITATFELISKDIFY